VIEELQEYLISDQQGKFWRKFVNAVDLQRSTLSVYENFKGDLVGYRESGTAKSSKKRNSKSYKRMKFSSKSQRRLK